MIKSKAITKEGLVNLYRSLVRLTSKLDGSILRVPKESKQPLVDEKLKYKLDRRLYLSQLKFEIRYHARQEFNVEYSKVESLLAAYDRGVEFVNLLKHKNLSKFIEKLIEYRTLIFERQQRDFGIENDVPKQIVTKERAKPLSLAAKIRLMRENIQKSNEYSHHLLRRYIKQKQVLGHLPSPQRLPYTPETNFKVDYNPKLGIPESTKTKAMKLAYSTKYIDAIIKPSIAYDINKFHYLAKLDKTVNIKGPTKVRIGITNAGPIPVPYIKLPYVRKRQMQAIAVDIKKMMTIYRIQAGWLENTIGTVKSFKDGSFGIQRSQGFGPEEIMYPKSYYENLALGEAIWEYLMESESNPEKLIEIVDSWTRFIDVTSHVLSKKINFYRRKYGKLMNGKILKRQVSRLQKKQNLHFDKLLRIYASILKDLKDNQVHKHSEFINRQKNRTRYSSHEMYGNVDENINGISEIERYGLGMNLGDYLKKHGYESFQFGNRFYDRFKFKV